MSKTFTEWCRGTYRNLKTNPKQGVIEGGYTTYLGLWHSLTSRWPIGENIYERDWDLLIVLDACRVDALRAVEPEYEFISNVESIISLGSGSLEWISKTFTRDYTRAIRKTAYLTSNGFCEKAFVDREYPPSKPVPFEWCSWDVVDAETFGHLDLSWEVGHDEKFGIVPPRYMTDRTIMTGRDMDFERYIVHYYQPHIPYLKDAIQEGRPPTPAEEDPWNKLRTGAITRDTIWEMYLDNLRLVLNDVQVLLENFDAQKVAITADHGEVFGQYGIYGHQEGVPYPTLKRVPWMETTAADTSSYDPDVSIDSTDAPQLEEHLRNLGYRL